MGFNGIEFKSPQEVFGGLNEVRGLGLSLTGEQGVYFSGAAIDKNFQSAGLYKRMNEERIGEALKRGLKVIFTETQNPRVESGIIGTLTAMKHDGIITGYTMEERGFLPGLYGRCLYMETPVDEKIQFDRLDYQAGDAYALIFHLEY